MPAFTPVAGVIDGAAVATGTCPDSTRATLPALVCATHTLVSGPSTSPAGNELGLVSVYSPSGAP